MKKVFKMEELDCAHCAQKMQDAIEKLPSVEKVTINFLTQKMTLEAPQEQMEEILLQAEKICKKIEPDCRIIH